MFSYLKNLAKKAKSKILFLTLLAPILLMTPSTAHASPFSFLIGKVFEFTGSGIGKLFYLVGGLIAFLGGMIVSVLIWVLQIIVLASDNIVNSPAVQTAFPIVLSIANLGFVLAVIVIAVATILRQESYGIKQLLAKVIIMAVMVNFGLVISGAILGFSNRITNYFLDSMTGGSPLNLAKTITGAMNPGTVIMGMTPDEMPDFDAKEVPTGASPTPSAAATLGAGMGSTIIPITGLYITIATMVIMIVAFFSLIATFIKRYLMLTFYLILLPLAWMASIFPPLKNWSSKWWSGFIENVFYPPVVIFFLWLALRIAEDASYKNTLRVPIEASAGFLHNLISAPLQLFLDKIIMVGIILGGSYAAKQIGLVGASAALGTTEKMKGWATGKVKTGARRAGVGAIAGAKQAGSWASNNKTVSGLGKRIATIPVVGGALGSAGKIVSTQARAWTARGEKVLSEAVSKESTKDVSAMGEKELLIRAERATGLERAAMLERAAKDPKLMAKLMNVDGFREGVNNSLPGERATYERYGFKDAHESALLASGKTYEDKQKNVDDAEKAKKDMDAKENATDEEKKSANDALIKAEKELTDALKKLTPEAANNLIFNKDGEIIDEKRAKNIMKRLAGPNGWPAGKFTQMIQQASEDGRLDSVKGLFEGLEAKDIGSSIAKALENGALKNLGIDGASVMGEELFAKARKYHGIGENADGKKIKSVEQRRNKTRERLKREGGGFYSEETLKDLEAGDNLDE